jgi:16S rRNA A1518/A1519 N6-dimethyltransferase RsmA/KsgA/DIM1 with predicted DNA glycosylase/AP lyase activity
LYENRELWQSQNFLKRPKFVKYLIDKTSITNNDLVIEIGPGRGIITNELAKKAGNVIAVEIDKRLVADLTLKFKKKPTSKLSKKIFLNGIFHKINIKFFQIFPLI